MNFSRDQEKDIRPPAETLMSAHNSANIVRTRATIWRPGMEAVPSNCTGRDLVGHVAEVRSQLTWTGNAKRHLAITERRHKALKITLAAPASWKVVSPKFLSHDPRTYDFRCFRTTGPFAGQRLVVPASSWDSTRSNTWIGEGKDRCLVIPEVAELLGLDLVVRHLSIR